MLTWFFSIVEDFSFEQDVVKITDKSNFNLSSILFPHHRDHKMLKFFLLLLLTLNLLISHTLPISAQTLPPTFTPAQIEKLNDLKEKAFNATKIGDFGTAEDYWTELIERFPQEAALWSNRGNTRVSQNQLELAIADYNQAIKLAPDAPDPYLNRGTALASLGQWDEAIASYNRVLEIDPQDPAAFNNRGNAQAGLGAWNEAIADYKKAIELASEYPLARANYTLALYQIGESENAMRNIRNLLRRYPQFADMRAALTALLWVQGKHGEAESNWVSVAELDPRYQNLEWVAKTRHWPPLMVEALAKFLNFDQSQM